MQFDVKEISLSNVLGNIGNDFGIPRCLFPTLIFHEVYIYREKYILRIFYQKLLGGPLLNSPLLLRAKRANFSSTASALYRALDEKRPKKRKETNNVNI